MAAGYEVVEDDRSGGNVGTNDDGSEIKGVLMRIPEKWYKEDQGKKARELDKIDERDLERKTVFIVAEESAEYASKVITKFWHQEAPPPLFVYNNKGKLLEQEGYELAVAGIISQSHLWDGATAQAR